MADDDDAAVATDDATATNAAPEIATRYGVPVTESSGQAVLHPRREHLAELVMELRDEHGFGMCIDVTAVDYLAYELPRRLPASVEPERFELIVGLLSHSSRERLRLRVQVPEADPVVPSLFDVHPGTEALEREVYDMFGIRFEDHPDLTRILMPEDWIGHPLRKDYAIGRIPVQFKGVENTR
ncbi:MAG: NADH-quinone oxidoreductase subunit [Acidimicrobiaceae bacterium]|jgi:NADH-quinone oxidoreductase subunit C